MLWSLIDFTKVTLKSLCALPVVFVELLGVIHGLCERSSFQIYHFSLQMLIRIVDEAFDVNDCLLAFGLNGLVRV